MGLPVSPCASHLPLGPDGVGLDGTPNDLDVDVRDERKDLLPIPAHLSSAAKASGWMCRSLVLVVLGIPRCHGLEIMLVRRAHQPIDRRKRLLHAFPPRFHSSRLEPMASMGRKSQAVKGRSYDASLRREQARRNHDRIIEMAQRRFLRTGYGPTTISAIAKDAGVSVDTIYKSFGGKPGLIRAMTVRALEGTGPVPAEQRSDDLQAREHDPRQLISGWGVFVTEVAPLAAPIV